MKSSVRYILLLLIIALALSLQPVGIHAASTPTLAANHAVGQPGDVVDVTVTIDHNPGFIAAILVLTFDNDALELVAVEDNDFWARQTAHGDAKTSPYILSFNGDTLSGNYTDDGILVTLRFRIKETAKVGTDYEISLSYDYENYDILNFDLEPVAFALVSGKISVGCQHKNTRPVNGSTPTCTQEGHTDGLFCIDCNTLVSGGEPIAATGIHADADGIWETDGENHWHICACGAELDKAAHAGGTATCTQQAICQICSIGYGTIDSAVHAYEQHTVEPTCTAAGSVTYTCAAEGCGYSYSETISATGHTEIADAAVVPTCEATGLTEGKHCRTCGEVLVAQETVAALEHTYGEWSVQTPATAEQEGSEVRSCTECGSLQTRAIEKLPQTQPANPQPITPTTIPATAPATSATQPADLDLQLEPAPNSNNWVIIVTLITALVAGIVVYIVWKKKN